MEETARFNRVVSFDNNTKFPVTYKWPHGQAVKTPPFHGGNMGSSPVGVTSKILKRTQFALGFLLVGAPHENGDEHVGSRTQLALWRSPGAKATTFSESSPLAAYRRYP